MNDDFQKTSSDGKEPALDAAKEHIEKVLQKIQKEGALLKDALNVDPQMLSWLYAEGYRLYQAGKVDEALPLFGFLNLVDPKNPIYLQAQAVCHTFKKDYEKAIECHEKIIFFINPKDPIPWYHIADCYLKLEKKECAMMALTLFLTTCKSNSEYDVNLYERASRMMAKLTEACVDEAFASKDA